MSSNVVTNFACILVDLCQFYVIKMIKGRHTTKKKINGILRESTPFKMILLLVL